MQVDALQAPEHGSVDQGNPSSAMASQQELCYMSKFGEGDSTAGAAHVPRNVGGSYLTEHSRYECIRHECASRSQLRPACRRLGESRMFGGTLRVLPNIVHHVRLAMRLSPHVHTSAASAARPSAVKFPGLNLTTRIMGLHPVLRAAGCRPRLEGIVASMSRTLTFRYVYGERPEVRALDPLCLCSAARIRVHKISD